MCKYCLYCDRDLPLEDFSDEHIWPSALGGNNLPNVWRIDVCRRCNTISGLFVDGAFARNILIRNQRDEYDYKFLGRLKEHSLGEELDLDIYFGKHVKIYHVREKDTEVVWGHQVGGDPRNRQSREFYSKVFVSFQSKGIEQKDDRRAIYSEILPKIVKAFGRAS